MFHVFLVLISHLVTYLPCSIISSCSYLSSCSMSSLFFCLPFCSNCILSLFSSVVYIFFSYSIFSLFFGSLLLSSSLLSLLNFPCSLVLFFPLFHFHSFLFHSVYVCSIFLHLRKGGKPNLEPIYRWSASLLPMAHCERFFQTLADAFSTLFTIQKKSETNVFTVMTSYWYVLYFSLYFF